MSDNLLTDDTWLEIYECEENPFVDDSAFNGCMFETYGEELEHVFKVHKETPERVWTFIDCDGEQYITSGFHLVNRLGYFITKEPCKSEMEEYIVDFS